MQVRRLSAAIASAGLLLCVSACGGDDPSSDPEGEASATPTFSNHLGGDPEQLAAIEECLAAAGLDDALPTGGFSGGPPSDRPSDMPTGMPTDGPSGGPRGGPGGMLQDPEVQAALEACGIELPSGPPSAVPTPSS